jgi:glycine/D-amino acid oxidase-like deaminating enzyme
MLDGVTMEYRWGGHLCLSRNATSGFGEVREHLYTAVCQNGLGTVKGTLAGMLIAELASGGNHPLLAEMLAAPQPKALPPEPFTGIGVRTTLWWKQRRALRER